MEVIHLKLLVRTFCINKTCMSSVQLNECGAVPIFGVIFSEQLLEKRNRMYLDSYFYIFVNCLRN